MKRLIMALLLVPAVAQAEIRVNLLTKLNEYVDDANNTKMSQDSKIRFLDQVGEEYGRRGVYVRRDTIVTSSNTESYALNSDFAGALQGVYFKRGQIRTVLPVIDRDSAFRAPNVKTGTISYVFVEEDQTLGVQAIPLTAETLVVLYYALPGALTGDSTEWDLPDYYEGAALLDAAAEVLRSIPTQWANVKAGEYTAAASAKLSELKNPPEVTRQLGDTPR